MKSPLLSPACLIKISNLKPSMSTLEVHIMNCVAKLFVGTGKKRSQNKRMFFCWENIHAFLVRRYVEGRYTREKMGMNRLLLPDAYIYCCCVFSLFRVCVHSLSCTSVYAFLRFFVRHHRIQNGFFFSYPKRIVKASRCSYPWWIIFTDKQMGTNVSPGLQALGQPFCMLLFNVIVQLSLKEE